ncbi:hypothetical protein ZIOFF_049357 [Zingiber officinale]|uniref:Complex I assembly factor TIMMDC1, mitochondrial n=1 Tax=Zingiber officinale TaxID=94328 RepID=A0A8J5FSQ2_ZINOF|nr:hypothetical protein ZIOFF_049357 [Zingiber officinale]
MREDKNVVASSPPNGVVADGPPVDTAVPLSSHGKVKPGTVSWVTATIVGVFAGLLYGGSKEASASVSKDAEVTLKLGSTRDKREQYRIMRDAMEKRFIRVARGSLVGGVRLGMFTAAFYGLQDLLAEKRGVHDVYNVVTAGSATAATFGLICEKNYSFLLNFIFQRKYLILLFVSVPGSPMWRARNVLLGSVLGAGICFPLGWVHLKLVEMANKELSNSKSADTEGQNDTNKTGVGAAIEKLEERLRR